MENSSVPGIRATACWALGIYQAQLLAWAKWLDGGSEFAQLVDARLIPHLRTLDSEKTLVEVTSLLERAAEYPGADATLKMMAKRDHERIVREFSTLAVGSRAPEIEGTTLAGDDLQLFGYRGKVVVLKFWSTTCIPCLRMIPQEKALLDKYREQPFALLGVNTDAERERALTTVAKHAISWPNWWDGEDAVISKSWGLSFLPTVYVIDHNGIIRYKTPPGRGTR